MTTSAVKYPQYHKPDWFESYTGRKVYPTIPEASDVVVDDIAHALSLCCRYAGHCKTFYSVGVHSLFVYHMVSAHTDDLNTLKYALMHDAAEAYIHDITRPMKVSPDMEWYRDLEKQWETWIAIALDIDLSRVDFQLVKEADNHALKIEARTLVHSGGRDWNIPETRPFPGKVVHYTTPEAARDAFLAVWSELNGRH
ncbi:hypothetical protein [Mariprofundus ferrooxydans]|uniref:hypothetical protein n=1 Tax=Mariprofundus ferrooxydans TaxID=314344 RepID=UPI00143159AB|nr:hypothetical protein [Mariprofundus ferrooxydans]